jgi:phospholipid/cholesterol/gamma-HCH transport system substrate-binding protein
MKNSTSRKIKLGIFISVILAVLLFSVYYIGKNQNLFHSVIKVYTVFDDVKGLNSGSNIRFSGISVGTVTDIEILEDTVVRVEMAIKKEFFGFIKKDSKVEIDNEGLMGSKILIIHHGSDSSPALEENDRLLAQETINVEDILQEATRIVQNSRDAAKNILDVTEHVISGKGSLGRLLYDTILVTDVNFMLERLKASSENARQITEAISQGEGDLGKLVYSDSLTNSLGVTFANLEDASKKVYHLAGNLDKATKQINEGDGLMNSLLYDTTMITKADTTIEKLNRSIVEITETAERIKESWIINLFSKKKKK